MQGVVFTVEKGVIALIGTIESRKGKAVGTLVIAQTTLKVHKLGWGLQDEKIREERMVS